MHIARTMTLVQEVYFQNLKKRFGKHDTALPKSPYPTKNLGFIVPTLLWCLICTNFQQWLRNCTFFVLFLTNLHNLWCQFSTIFCANLVPYLVPVKHHKANMLELHLRILLFVKYLESNISTKAMKKPYFCCK